MSKTKKENYILQIIAIIATVILLKALSTL